MFSIELREALDRNDVMYYDYIMNYLATLSDDTKTVRTQITLTRKLKQLIEERARQTNQSLSEYLRRGAWISLLLEENEAEELGILASQVIGSVDLSKHPEWETLPKVKKWVRKLRSEWK